MYAICMTIIIPTFGFLIGGFHVATFYFDWILDLAVPVIAIIRWHIFPFPLRLTQGCERRRREFRASRTSIARNLHRHRGLYVSLAVLFSVLFSVLILVLTRSNIWTNSSLTRIDVWSNVIRRDQNVIFLPSERRICICTVILAHFRRPRDTRVWQKERGTSA